MNINYSLPALLLAAPALAQPAAYRPFRPGLVYVYAEAGGGPGAHSLRVDSAYATPAGDSVYAFNRLVRPAADGAGQCYQSRNNAFGARLRWQPGTADYVLEVVDEGAQAAPRTLRLRPRAAVGSTWASGAGTATLVARTWAPLPGGGQDSVALIRDPGNGGDFVVSRRYGLLSGPVLANPNAATGAPVLAAAELPAPLLASVYSPLRLFGAQPGDEFGYVQEPFSFGLPCEQSHLLRRVLARQLTADSLVITFQEQRQRQTFGAPGCGAPAGTELLPVRRGRLAVALRSGQSGQYPALPLLAGEYRPYDQARPPALLTGRLRFGEAGAPACAAGPTGPTGLALQAVRLYPATGRPGRYVPGLDALGQTQAFALGLGAVRDYDTTLEYYRRATGSPLTCGPAATYATLLPSRASQAAAAFAASPNPAAAAVAVALAGPASAGSRLALRDALGRTVWETALVPGQTNVAVPLAGRPAGLYLVQLQAPGAAPATLRLVKE